MNVRVLRSRPLVYTDAAPADEDRPPHVRAGSAIAARGDELFVVQDDASFIARVRGDEVTSIALPRGPGGRRRFEAALGNKYDKLDLEACAFVPRMEGPEFTSGPGDDQLWAFGSGSLPVREVIVRVSLDGEVVVEEHHALYAQLRAALGATAINIEGVARVGDELWWCHRGNTGPGDTPAIVRTRELRVLGVQRFDLGGLGFTDACALDDDRVVFLAAAEASANAIDDGAVLGCSIGVIAGDRVVELVPLVLDGQTRKAEGIALRGIDHAWITVDPDDPEQPTTLYDVCLG